MSITELQEILSKQREEYFDLKEHGKEYYKKHIRQQAEDLAAANGGDPDIIEKQLLDRDQMRRDWAKINFYIHGRRKGGLNKLIIPDPVTGERKECFT